MFNRKIESRSEYFYQAATPLHPLTAESGTPFPFVDEKSLELARLFAQIDPRTSERWASQKLVKLLSNLMDQDNSAWTARVATALAYLSTPQD